MVPLGFEQRLIHKIYEYSMNKWEKYIKDTDLSQQSGIQAHSLQPKQNSQLKIIICLQRDTHLKIKYLFMPFVFIYVIHYMDNNYAFLLFLSPTYPTTCCSVIFK